ncbi:MAG TPA: group 1 truncated hemoglobin [Gammaproteobacteria bacterium]|nr:group 1 truncated hemoglobin [Gammaproteobacteria bacterium]
MYNVKRFKPVIMLLVLSVGLVPYVYAAGSASLYDRLGGKKAIKAVVAEFTSIVGGDQRINHYFAKTDLTHFKAMMVDQICEGSGGPCKYKGRDMKTTHKGMAITDADFNAVVEDLVKALDKFKVAKKEQDDLLGILGPMKPDIVGQ